jgi:hypothetical protein
MRGYIRADWTFQVGWLDQSLDSFLIRREVPMRKKLLGGLVSILLAAFWWVAERLWGDKLFAAIQPYIPERVANAVPTDVIEVFVSFGVPLLLITPGGYLFLSVWRRIQLENPVRSQRKEPAKVSWLGLDRLFKKKILRSQLEKKLQGLTALEQFLSDPVIVAATRPVNRDFTHQEFEQVQQYLMGAEARIQAAWKTILMKDSWLRDPDFARVVKPITFLHENTRISLFRELQNISKANRDGRFLLVQRSSLLKGVVKGLKS